MAQAVDLRPESERIEFLLKRDGPEATPGMGGAYACDLRPGAGRAQELRRAFIVQAAFRKGCAGVRRVARDKFTCSDLNYARERVFRPLREPASCLTLQEESETLARALGPGRAGGGVAIRRWLDRANILAKAGWVDVLLHPDLAPPFTDRLLNAQ